MPKYAIVNDSDRPDARHVTQCIDGKYYYLVRALEPHMKQYDGMQPNRPTCMEDFGFEITDRSYEVVFRKVRDETATYRDGKPRKWQGESIFMLPKVILIKGHADGTEEA